MIFLFTWVSFRFHVNFAGCITSLAHSPCASAISWIGGKILEMWLYTIPDKKSWAGLLKVSQVMFRCMSGHE